MYKYMRADLKCTDQSLYIVLCHIYIVSVIPLCNVRAVVHLRGVLKHMPTDLHATRSAGLVPTVGTT
jgi:hypothetical protein